MVFCRHDKPPLVMKNQPGEWKQSETASAKQFEWIIIIVMVVVIVIFSSKSNAFSLYCLHSCPRIITSHVYPYQWESNCRGIRNGYFIVRGSCHRGNAPLSLPLILYCYYYQVHKKSHNNQAKSFRRIFDVFQFVPKMSDLKALICITYVTDTLN